MALHGHELANAIKTQTVPQCRNNFGGVVDWLDMGGFEAKPICTKFDFQPIQGFPELLQDSARFMGWPRKANIQHMIARIDAAHRQIISPRALPACRKPPANRRCQPLQHAEKPIGSGSVIRAA